MVMRLSEGHPSQQGQKLNWSKRLPGRGSWGTGRSIFPGHGSRAEGGGLLGLGRWSEHIAT